MVISLEELALNEGGVLRSGPNPLLKEHVDGRDSLKADDEEVESARKL